MLRIVTDGAADLPAGWGEKYNINLIPINIHFGEETFLQYVEMDLPEFYEKIEEGGEHPKTSQPSPHQFVEYYKKIAEPGDTILSVHVTSKLSGTYASAVAAAEEVKDQFKVYPVDSKVGSLGIAFMCRTARQMDGVGKSIDEIVAHLEDVRERIWVILTLNTLEYARRSGRVGTLRAALASVLDVKPIAILEDGMLDMAERVRTRNASLKRVLEIGKEKYGDKPVHIGALHARDPKSAERLMEDAKGMFNYKDAELADLSVSLAINLGPGTAGLVLYPAD